MPSGTRKPPAPFDATEWAKQQAHADVERRAARASNDAKSARALAEVWRREAEDASAKLDIVLGLQAANLKPREVPALPKRGDRHSASVACTLASDWHFDEEVNPAHLPGGRNRYTPEIAFQRADNYARNFLKHVETNRASTTIRQAVVFLLGDFYSGWIHQELMANTAMSPVKAAERLVPLLQGVVDLWLAKGDFEKLHLLCMVGNHSRITEREHSAPAEAALEYLVYKWLASHYQDNPQVQFQIAESRWVVTSIAGVNVRWLHGNNWNYAGGVGGLLVPMTGFTNRVGRAEPADFTVCGHWHTYHPSAAHLVNGSLIGQSAYSTRYGFPWEPPQQAFFLLSEKYRRVTVQAPIFVE